MPDAAQIEQISAAAAFREVQAQSDEFTGGRAAKSVASPSTPLLSSESAASGDREAEAEVPQEDAAQAVEPDESQAEEEVTGEAEPADLEAAGSGEGQDLLELIPPSADSELDEGYGFEESAQPAGDNGDVQALRENLARTEEELINQQQQNSYLEERIRELESELEAAGDGSVADADLANMQERLREERQAVVKQTERSDPWYSRLSIWLIGLLVAIAAVAGWLLSRRGQAAAADEAVEESLRSIQSEAEDVLRVLGDETQAEAAQAAEPETDTEPESDTEAKSDTESETGSKPTTPARKRHSGDADAELLDEDSSDPEIQLDLARAYISMGDKEAARVILEEVVSNGTEEQQEEAKKMLGIL
jgi:FimV-like protein